MSLQTDIIFVKALRSNADLIAELPAGDVYNNAIALPDEQADNAPTPYIIVSYDGMNNQETTKDNAFGGFSDMVTVGITVAAKTRPQLARLAIAARQTVESYFRAHVMDDSDDDFRLIPNQFIMQAQRVNYDSLKPCFWQDLQFLCDTDPD